MSDDTERSSKMRTEKCTLDSATWKFLEMLLGVAWEGKVNFFRSY